jgi:tRNA(Ile)-lysidine synthase
MPINCGKPIVKRAPKSVESTPINKTSSIIDQIRNAMSMHRLVPYGGSVIVGVSGGPDSTALLHVLFGLRHELGIKIIVAHFNHRLRRESSRDEKFTAALAEQFQLKFQCERAKSRPPKTGSLEDWARRQRFDFLIRAAAKHKADAVALAHTADDLAETVIMRVLRGSGLLGLKAMGESRDMAQVSFIRPMLSVTKKEVLGYLKGHRLNFCTDATNAKMDFFRNKIRLKLLPLLEKEYNANITHALVNLSKTAGEDYEFLAAQARTVWNKVVIRSSSDSAHIQMDLKKLRQSHPAMRRIVIRMAYEYLKGDLNQLTFEHVQTIELLMFEPSGRVDLPAGIIVEKTKEHLCLSLRPRKHEAK